MGENSFIQKIMLKNKVFPLKIHIIAWVCTKSRLLYVWKHYNPSYVCIIITNEILISNAKVNNGILSTL